jgi:hypothetical protein
MGFRKGTLPLSKGADIKETRNVHKILMILHLILEYYTQKKMLHSEKYSYNQPNLFS